MQVRAALLAVTCGLVLGLSPGAAAGPPAVTVSRVPYGDGLTLERHRPAALADEAPVVVLVHDLLVGLGGYYGWDGSDVPPEVVTDGTVAWFGAPPEDDPDAWHEGAEAIAAVSDALGLPARGRRH